MVRGGIMTGLRIAVLALLFAPLAAAGSEGLRLQKAPVDYYDLASLQRGAQVFVNYCLNCHSANYMRYDRLRDLGLSESQIRDNLILTGVKVGELMRVAMDRNEAREWFGMTPPDLTVVARSRSSEAGSGADWLYTYLRGFYRDAGRPNGWNNIVFDNVGMPHALWQLSGQHQLKVQEFKTHEEAIAALLQIPAPARLDEEMVDTDQDGKAAGKRYVVKSVQPDAPGTLTPQQYDKLVGDLVNYLVYMGEPARNERKVIGIYVLLFLGVLWVLAYFLKKEYWKDVH